MFGKLLTLLLHAKTGAISGVFLLGATGALVSVSASNGVTTVTITEASPSPSAPASPVTTTNHVATTTPMPLSPSVTTTQPLSPLVTTACTDEATALAFQVNRVDTAATGFHTDLAALKGQRDAATLKKADAMLKLISHAATKAIHGTATAACIAEQKAAAAAAEAAKEAAENDTTDTDDQTGANNEQTGENDTEDADTAKAPATVTTPAVVAPTVKNDDQDEQNDGASQKLGLTFTGTASAIADQAIIAMQAAFDAAKTAPVVTTPTTPKSTTPKSPSTKGPWVSPTKGPEQKGQHD